MPLSYKSDCRRATEAPPTRLPGRLARNRMCFLPAVSFPGQDWCEGKKAEAGRRKLETWFLPQLLPAASSLARLAAADRLAQSPSPGNRYFYEPAFIF